MARETDGPADGLADTAPSKPRSHDEGTFFSEGQRITRELSVSRHLGKGGQGDVYEAYDSSSGTAVAIKVLSRKLSSDSQVVTRLEREAATASAIRHPNVTRIYGLERTESGEILIRMELLNGEPLDRLLARGALSVEEACAFVVQIAEGLGAAHALGIIHRDVKPANIFLADTPSGRVVKVMDFGIAKAAASWDLTALTHTGSLIGTPAYMSPEQILLPDELDHRSDIYSLGLVFWEMLTGQRVFRGREVAQVLMRQVKTQPPSPRMIRPEIPRPIAAVVMRCLQKRPESRFSTMRALVDRLQQARSEPDVPTVEDPEPPAVVSELRSASFGPSERQLRPPPQAPSKWLLVAAAGVAAAALLGLIGALSIQEDRAPVVEVAPEPEPPLPPPAPVPPPEPAGNGTLHLTSEPPGVAVFLAGAVLGKTPLDVPLAPDVEHELSVRREGYQTAAVMVRLKPGETWRRHVELERKEATPRRRKVRRSPPPPPPPPPIAAATHGWVRINTAPWTEVYFRGQSIGTTPIGKAKLPVGRHELRFVNKPRGIDVRRVVDVRGEALEKLRFVFER